MSSRYSVASSTNTSHVNRQRQDAFQNLTGERPPSVLVEPKHPRSGSSARRPFTYLRRRESNNTVHPDDSISVIMRSDRRRPSSQALPETQYHAPIQNSSHVSHRAPVQVSGHTSSRTPNHTSSRTPSHTQAYNPSQEPAHHKSRSHHRDSDRTTRQEDHSRSSHSSSRSHSNRDRERDRESDRTHRSSGRSSSRHHRQERRSNNDDNNDYLPRPFAHRDSIAGKLRPSYEGYNESHLSDTDRMISQLGRLNVNYNSEESDPETPKQLHFDHPAQRASSSAASSSRSRSHTSGRSSSKRSHPPRAFRYTTADMPLDPVDHRNSNWSSNPSEASYYSSHTNSYTTPVDHTPRVTFSNSPHGPSPYQNFHTPNTTPTLSRRPSTRSSRRGSDSDTEPHRPRDWSHMQWERPKRRPSQSSGDLLRTPSGKKEMPRWLKWINNGY